MSAVKVLDAMIGALTLAREVVRSEEGDSPIVTLLEAMPTMKALPAPSTNGTAPYAKKGRRKKKPRDEEDEPRALGKRAQNFHEIAVKIAKYLGSVGPKRTGDIADALDMTDKTILKHLQNHEWFQKTGGKLHDPYELSQAGFVALKEMEKGGRNNTD